MKGSIQFFENVTQDYDVTNWVIWHVDLRRALTSPIRHAAYAASRGSASVVSDVFTLPSRALETMVIRCCLC